MPRVSRENSKTITQTYHIIIRGINKQDIFFDNYDKKKFLEELLKTKNKYDYDIYAYALMNNHVHLAIYDKSDSKSNIMHMLCTSYAQYFNRKYERVGHLFQNRFKSICINTDRYLLNLIRYIHKNPENDNICKMESYEWSSYNEYLYGEKIASTNFILEMFGDERKQAIEKFIFFNRAEEKEFSDGEFENEKMSDDVAIENIRRILEIDNLQKIQLLNKNVQEEYILKIIEIKGITVEQISRILGIDRKRIYRIKIKNK